LALANATITPGSGATGIAGDANLPLIGKVHLTGTMQDASHYQLSAQVGSVAVGGVATTSDTVTLNNSGEALAGDASLPLVGKVHLAGTVQDAAHYSLSASLARISAGGITLSNDTVTVSNSGVGFAGNATVPPAGNVHLQGSIQPAGGHYSLTAQVGGLTVGGFGLTNTVVTMSDQGETLAGDADLPLVGKIHLQGSIQPGSADTLTGHLASVTAAGVALTNDTVTLGPSGATFAGDASLPLVGKVHLQGSLQGGGRYSLAARLGSVTIVGFGLTNDTVTLSNSGISLEGDANLPLAGKVHLKGTVQDAAHFSLGVPLGKIVVDGIGLTNNAVTLSNAGLALRGNANLPLVGTVAFAATIASGGAFAFTATHAPITVLGGLVHLDNIQLTLTTGSLIVTAHAEVAQIGQADFRGSISPNGNYDLKASASITIAGFTIHGADLDLGTQSLGASFDLPIPVIGDVAFEGSFSAGGHWSIGATIPGPIFVGTFPLQDLHFQVSDTSLTLGARTGVQGILDAGVTGTIYYSGLFNLTVDAHALSLGGFSLANATITLGNSDPDHVFRMHVHATAGIPHGPSLYLDGVLDGHGNFDLVVTETIGIAGLNLSQGNFELNHSGLTVHADWT
jgi:sorbitol-specific phosphotransferase system component IIA